MTLVYKIYMKILRQYFAPFITLRDAFTKSAGRSLTTGEVNFARALFGDQIDYDAVRVFARSIKQGTASVIGNMMFFSEDEKNVNDLTSVDGVGGIEYAKTVSLFMHEMVHIWQNQNKTHDWKQQFAMKWQSLILRRDVYKYDLRDDQDFRQMGIEQQASCVEDFILASALKTLSQDIDFEALIMKSPRHPKDGVRAVDVLNKNKAVIQSAFKVKPS